MSKEKNFSEIEGEAKKNAKKAQETDAARYAGVSGQDSTGAALHRGMQAELKDVAEKLRKTGEYFGRHYSAVPGVEAPDELDRELLETIKDGFGFDAYADKLSKTAEILGRLAPALEQYAGRDTSEKWDRKERTVGREADEFADIKEMLDGCMENLDGCLIYEESNSPMFRNLYSMVANTAVLLEDMANGRLAAPSADSQTDEFGRAVQYISCPDKSLSLRTETVLKREASLRGRYGSDLYLRKNYIQMGDVPLFPHEPDEKDIAQGYLGDCYLLASLSAVAKSDPARIKEAMRDNGDGTVTVRFFDDAKKPVYVHIEKSIPYVETVNDTPFARGALWVKMIEKAYAASDLNRRQAGEPGKTYATADGGLAENFLKAFLGPDAKVDSVSSYSISYPNGVKGNYSADELKDFDTIKAYAENSEMPVGATRSEADFAAIRARNGQNDAALHNKSVESANSDSYYGLFPGHAYTVTGTEEVNGEKYIVLRNPHNTEGIIIGQDGKPTISQEPAHAGEVHVELRNFRMLFRTITTVKTDLKPVDRTKLQQAREFQHTYGGRIAQLTAKLKNTEHIFGFAFGDSPEFTRLNQSAKKLAAVVNAEPPSHSVIEKCFREFVSSARAYKDYREAPAANAREEAEKREKNQKWRSVERLSAANAILQLADEYAAELSARDALQLPDKPTLDEMITADQPQAEMTPDHWITMEIINARVRQKKDALLQENADSFTAELAERTELAMKNPRFKELRYLICQGDLEENAALNRSLLQVRAMLRGGQGVDDLKKTEFASDKVIGPYLDLIAEAVTQDEAERVRDAEFTRNVLKDVLPPVKAPETQAAEKAPEPNQMERSPAKEAEEEKIRKVIDRAREAVNAEKSCEEALAKWHSRDERFGIPEYRKTERDDSLAFAVHVKKADRPARRELSLKGAAVFARMDGKNKEMLHVTEELVKARLRSERCRKALEYIAFHKDSMVCFFNFDNSPEAAAENAAAADTLANGSEAEKGRLIRSKMQTLTRKLQEIDMKAPVDSPEELVEFIDRNHETLNSVNAMKKFLSTSEGQHSGVTLDEITAFKTEIRTADRTYCARFNELIDIKNPLYQYIDTEAADKHLKNIGNRYAESLKECRDRLNALPGNGAGAAQRSRLTQQSDMCLAGILIVSMLNRKIGNLSIEKIDDLESSATDFYMRKEVAEILKDPNFKKLAEGYDTGALLKQEDGKTVLNVKEADNLAEFFKKMKNLDRASKEVETQPKKAAAQGAPVPQNP